MNRIDETHDRARTSWVESARSHPVFPLQNLPFGAFRPRAEGARGGVAIGDEILDLKRAVEAGLFSGVAEDAARAASGPTLNALMALGTPARVELRKRISALLADGTAESAALRKQAGKLLHRASDCVMQVPAAI